MVVNFKKGGHIRVTNQSISSIYLPYNLTRVKYPERIYKFKIELR